MKNKKYIFMPCTDEEMKSIRPTLTKYGISIKYDALTYKKDSPIKSVCVLTYSGKGGVTFERKDAIEKVFHNATQKELSKYFKFDNFKYVEIFKAFGIELTQEDIDNITSPYPDYKNLSIFNDLQLPKYCDDITATYIKLLHMRDLWLERDGVDLHNTTNVYGLFLCRSNENNIDKTISIISFSNAYPTLRPIKLALTKSLFCFPTKDAANLFLETFKDDIDKIKMSLSTIYQHVNIDGVGSISII